MAGPDKSRGVDKRRRNKKKKSRTEVSSSSESESEVERKSTREEPKVVSEDALPKAPEEKSTKKLKQEKRKKISTQQTNGDVSMDDAPAVTAPHDEEDFSSIYLRKITAELGDDLNTVREANDFTSRSLPMLIHALKQGESCYGVEERRRIVTAAKTS